MAFLELRRLMFKQREHIQDSNGAIASRNKRKGSPCQEDYVVDGSVASCADINGSPCQDHDSSQSGQARGYSGVELPEDIWRHIHYLLPFRAAARAACMSRAFLSSWRCYPNLVLSEESLGVNGIVYRNDETAKAFTSRAENILKKHSGVGVKVLEICGAPAFNAKGRHYINSWLQMAVTPGLEKLTLDVSSVKNRYEFPCSVLSHGNGDLIQFLDLTNCTFRPTVGLDCFRSLTRLYLCDVRITGDELGCLLSNSFALEQVKLMYCDKIRYLNIPCLLLRLSYLEVSDCRNLRGIESKAPNISSLRFSGHRNVQLSLGEAAPRVKNLCVQCPGALRFTCSEFVSSMPNLESLIIDSASEMANTPVLSSKFLHLKYLEIWPPKEANSYDYLSLVSFLDASPCLETFLFNACQTYASSDFSDAWELREVATEHKHEKLATVMICPFASTKSMVELTCHILAAATSLEHLTLETRSSGYPASGSECDPIQADLTALQAINTYIRPKVPSTVNFNVMEFCIRRQLLNSRYRTSGA